MDEERDEQRQGEPEADAEDDQRQGEPEADAEDDQRQGEPEADGEDEQRHQPSDVDLMGNDKRRPVVGQQYGATVRKQVTVYGIFLAVSVGLVIAFLTVVSGIDNAEKPLEDTGPWTEASAPQTTPRDIDFPVNGPEDTIPEDEIGTAVAPAESDAQTGE